MKGLAALVIESLQAADAAGFAAETWDELVREVSGADEAFIRRLITGTGPHARRRVHEMEATAALLAELGVEPTMTLATLASLQRIAEGATLPPLP
jgi:hypothetical protein